MVNPKAHARKPRKPALKKRPVLTQQRLPEKAHRKEEPIPQAPKPLHKPIPANKNVYAVGRRKTAVAQVILSSGDGTVTINNLPFVSYFQTIDLQHIAMQPLVAIGVEKKINVRGKIHGGGIHAQAESMRHAIARALIIVNSESRRVLKKQGFLTRDPRVKERKKPGLKRARRAPQFSKR